MNLSLLAPEWLVITTLVILTFFELFPVQDEILYKKIRNLLHLSGLIAVSAALICVHSTTQTAFNGTVISDPFAVFFKFIFLIAAGVVIQTTREFFYNRPERSHEFFLVLWITLAGFFLLVSANDFLIFFLALETVTLGFYVLNSYLKHDPSAIEAGMKYFILGSLASAVLIFGVSLLYVAAGSTLFPDVRSAFVLDPHNPLLVSGALMVLAGLFFKAGSFPFQFWIPDVYEGSPTPAVSFLSVASKAAAFAAILRLLYTVFPPLEEKRVMLFGTLALATLIYGNLGALVQTQMKRLLGYSSIGHAGYLLIGVAAGRSLGVSAVLYYLAAYAVTTLAVFLCVTIASRELASDRIDAYRGLGQKSPFLAGVLFIALLSSAGVPPLAGFSGKFFILLAAMQEGLTSLTLIGILAVVVSLYYYLAIVRTMYFEKPVSETPIALCSTSRIVLILLALAIAGAGIFQAPLLHITDNAARFLF